MLNSTQPTGISKRLGMIQQFVKRYWKQPQQFFSLQFLKVRQFQCVSIQYFVDLAGFAFNRVGWIFHRLYPKSYFKRAT